MWRISRISSVQSWLDSEPDGSWVEDFSHHGSRLLYTANNPRPVIDRSPPVVMIVIGILLDKALEVRGLHESFSSDPTGLEMLLRYQAPAAAPASTSQTPKACRLRCSKPRVLVLRLPSVPRVLLLGMAGVIRPCCSNCPLEIASFRSLMGGWLHSSAEMSAGRLRQTYQMVFTSRRCAISSFSALSPETLHARVLVTRVIIQDRLRTSRRLRAFRKAEALPS